MLKEIALDDVIYREDLYPRIEAKQDIIQQYATAVDDLPPILISQNNILIDGYHRWKAYAIAKKETIAAKVEEVASEKELKRLAYKLNSKHGLQLTTEEKKIYAQEMTGLETVADLANILSVSIAVINKWTQSEKRAIKEQRNKQIWQLYLMAENTQADIAEQLEITQQTVSNVIKDFTKKNIDSIFGKKWNALEDDPDHDKQKPYKYNIWSLDRNDKQTDFFGPFPAVWLENILYYHTKPLDVVYDPFAGNGTTIDVCKRHNRRYYCSDLTVIPGREMVIKQWDVKEKLPDDLPSPQLVFIDPPYWKQAERQYSDKKEDLANISLSEFYAAMENLFSALSKKMKSGSILAYVIWGTQWKNDLQYEDHALKFWHMLIHLGFDEIIRYILPYSSQQYNPQQMKEATNRKTSLVLHRDLVIFRKQ